MSKTSKQIQSMREGGAILARILDAVITRAKIGVLPIDLDAFAREEAQRAGAEPAFLHYQGYPAALCVSRNEEVVHGIPTDQPLQEGEIVGFDFGIRYKHLCTDAARTVIIGKPKKEQHRQLVETARKAFFKGASILKAGVTTGDLGHAIQAHIEQQGFSVVRTLVGHGVGEEIHEDPKVPNFGMPHTGTVLTAGMTIAIEPMITMGNYAVITEADGWTIVTRDHSMAAHYEETVLITENGYEILTKS